MRKIYVLFFFIGLSFIFSGCATPCENLSDLMCQELDSNSALCTIIRQESHRPEIFQRHCKALLLTWPQVGQLQLRSLNRRYEQYRRYISQKWSGKKKLEALDRAEVKMRMIFRRLFRLQAK